MRKTAVNEEIASLMLELSMLFHAGISAADALALLAGEDYKDILEGLPEMVDNGASLAEALRRSGKFPSYVCGLIEVGEKAGRTEEALSALSRYYDRRSRLNRRIRSALLYPALMLVLMLVVIGLLLIKVLPIFDDVYKSLGGRLEGLAGGLLTLGGWLDNIMPVLWVLIALAVVFSAVVVLVEPFQRKVLSVWRSSRGDKGIFRQMNTARIVQAMAMGISSGLQIDESLQLAGSLMEDVPPAKQRCDKCCEELDKGETLSSAMRASELLPDRSCRILELGMKSGTADTAMDQIAANLSEESENSVEDMVSRVEPALVLVCSLLVGLILLSVMLPLMHIMSAIG